MKRVLLFLFFVCTGLQLYAQNDLIWKKEATPALTSRGLTASESIYYQLDEVLLQQRLNALKNTSSKKQMTTLSFPNSEGVLESFSVWKTSNFEPELQAKYPEIQSYEGVSLQEQSNRIYFSISPIGVQSMTLKSNGKRDFIEAIDRNTKKYEVFSNKNKKSTWLCTTQDVALNSKLQTSAKPVSNTKNFKTLRLALSSTAEYTAYFGGTKQGALAGMNATMTRVNAIFNTDLSVKLVLIATNDQIIYTDPTTDPYSNASAGVDGAWNLELQQNLTVTIGNANYDIGHLFGGSGGGGDAGCIGCVCENPKFATDANAKGSAYTSPSDSKPEGDSFDIDYVAHEMGHQLGANHTFSFESEGTGVNVEPGSGSTIMGYAGVSDYDVQQISDGYFAYVSILQIQNKLASKSCAISTPIASDPPVVDAGLNYVIPISTAFVLKGIGSATDGNSLTYCWEQNDSVGASVGAQSKAIPSKVDGPLFRSFLPKNTAIRYMPEQSKVLAGALSSTWESVASVGRTLNFTLTARDNAAQGLAQTNTDAMVVTVNANTGPFVITSQDTENIAWQNGSQQTITWSVNNTTNLAGSTNVNIKLSTDGGVTYDTILASNTPNDGSQVITVPQTIKGTDCRILIEPTANIYYAINSKPIAVGYSVTFSTNTYVFQAPVQIPDGDKNYTKLTFVVPPPSNTQNDLAANDKIADVDVKMNFTHSYAADVDSYIQHPQGTVVRLFNRNCSSASTTLDLIYDDSGAAISCGSAVFQKVLPSDYLNIFNEKEAQGIWTFGIRDQFATDAGTLNSASLTITTKHFTLDNPEFETVDFAIYPNPNNGNFTVELKSSLENKIQILIHDLLGRKVYEQRFEGRANFIESIQMNREMAGVYLVTVIDGDSKTVRKIIIR
ncbi:reprolysin-like metallopeptidase [Flavobacterium sp. TMP13]|uniref:zinc-dependent metalloprotease n=1 Tax=Flavobacterium sp. TMP13 TaxID=3425950 RepID=UPI003D772F21